MKTIRHLVSKLGRAAAVPVIAAVFAAAAFGQSTESRIFMVNLSDQEVQRIIAKFTANESAFREALTNYVFNRSATVQSIGMGGQISGVFRRDSFLTFRSDGSRYERITYAPVSTLKEFNVTPQDLDDLGGINPFALEPKMVPQYNFRFVGKEKIDELELYVFDVSPKVMPDPKKTKERFFNGRIWVDDRDLMIVKSKGKALPETKDDKYPVVETWRENVDGKYWFPSYSYADDELVFDKGYTARIRMKVTYKDYALGRTDVKVIDEEEVYVEPTATPTPSPTPKKP